MAVINTNVNSLFAQSALKTNARAQAVAMQQLSTGLRVNNAKDDAAGLSIGQNMTSQVRGLNQAVRNSNDAISLVQVAEGALQETTSILQRMRELSVQAASDVNTQADREALNEEISQLQQELGRIGESTTFNAGVWEALNASG